MALSLFLFTHFLYTRTVFKILKLKKGVNKIDTIKYIFAKKLK